MTRLPWLRRRAFWSSGLATAAAALPLDGSRAGPLPDGPVREAGRVDVRQFGARGDGMTDDAPAINRAIQFARDHMMHVPPNLGFG